MSLKLDSLEESIRSCSLYLSRNRLPLFYYPPHVLNCSKEVERIRLKLTSDLYGARTKSKIQQLITLWETTVRSAIVLPAPELDSTDIVLWTLKICGFTISSEDKGTFKLCFANRSIDLTKVNVKTVATVFYLGEFEFILKRSEIVNGYVNVPLRFYLACIHPVLYNSRPLTTLGDIAPESLVEVAKFLDLETLPELIQTSSTIRSICDSEPVWLNILDNIARYTSAKPTGNPDDPHVSSKDRVRSLLDTQQRRRMMRFTNTLDVSDWASPFEFLSPTAAVDRRRRYRILDDMIL